MLGDDQGTRDTSVHTRTQIKSPLTLAQNIADAGCGTSARSTRECACVVNSAANIDGCL